jgi:hypothetical protein
MVHVMADNELNGDRMYVSVSFSVTCIWSLEYVAALLADVRVGSSSTGFNGFMVISRKTFVLL